MLSGPEIKRQIGLGAIVIKPFREEQLNPNSYDLTLGALFRVEMSHGKWMGHAWQMLDVNKQPVMWPVKPCDGEHFLQPGQLYLASTVEWTESHGFVPQISGKSSLGRLGIQVHQTAGFGDDGFKGRWTLEITVVHPVKIMAGMRIAQVCWFPLEGERMPYLGRYQGQQKAEPCKMWQDFITKEDETVQAEHEIDK